MKKGFIFVFFVCFVFFLGLFYLIQEKKDLSLQKTFNTEESIDQLWERTVGAYLKDDLWTEENAYDAGHYLMVPLHAAFLNDVQEWKNDFSHQVHLFMEAYKEDPNSIVDVRLTQLHYLYFLSRFMVLAEQQGNPELIPDGLDAYLYERINDIWLNEPAWQWGRDPFSGGMQERVLWKLNNKSVEQSYYRTIIDEELFTIAIAADIRAHEKFVQGKEAKSTVIDDILEKSIMIFMNEGMYQDNGGWLFQPGVWTDSPSYAYAGNSEIKKGMKPKLVENIAWDTSHSHRFPLWLTSLANAYDSNSEEHDFYKKVKNGLEIQFYETVLKEPTKEFPAYRTTNFMDGRNGVYRWNYSSLGKGTGYGPYELSGTFTIGWWTFLGTDRIKKVYEEMTNFFPLPLEVMDVYDGPDTGKQRHTIIRWPQSFNNGYTELIAILASDIPVE